MKSRFKDNVRQNGFTLIEVIMSVAILVVLSMAASNLMRNSFDLRFGLAESSQATQRANTALMRVSTDLDHIFFIGDDDTDRMTANRSSKSIFKLEKFKSDKLLFTTMSHRPLLQNASESDVVLVSYEIKEDPKNPGLSHLYRGLTKVVPEDLDAKLTEQILAENIKSFSIKLWDGERWSSDKWDSSTSTTSNKIPHMIQITVESWIGEPDLTISGQEGRSVKLTTVAYPTLVTLNTQELKKSAMNMRWY